MISDFDSIAEEHPVTRDAVGRLRGAGYDSVECFFREIPEEQRLRELVAYILGFTNSRRFVPVLVELEPFGGTVRFEALRSMARLGGRRAFERLREWLLSHPDPQCRYEAAYALNLMACERAYSTFVKVAGDSEEFGEIRGQALEGVAGLVIGLERRSVRYGRLVARLSELLESPSPDVRFWACFAAAAANCTPLLPALRKLVSDQEVAWCFWSVGEEAEDAIAMIETGRCESTRNSKRPGQPPSWKTTVDSSPGREVPT